MKYTQLGNSDLRVSRICLGCMGFGDASNGQHSWTVDEEHSREIIRRGLELGVNFFDTAIGYQSGTSEQYLGRALRDFARRDEVVVATKFLPRTNAEIAAGVSGQEHIRRLLDKSLQNLGTFVEQLTVKDVLEMNELRIVLEVKALESCVMKAADEDIDECIRVTESITVTDSAQDIKAKDEYFNNFIIHYCENSRIRDILHSLNAELSHPRHLVAFTEKRLEVMKQDHLKILKYIKARSYSRAAKALEKHHNNRYYGFMEEYMKMIIK